MFWYYSYQKGAITASDSVVWRPHAIVQFWRVVFRCSLASFKQEYCKDWILTDTIFPPRCDNLRIFHPETPFSSLHQKVTGRGRNRLFWGWWLRRHFYSRASPVKISNYSDKVSTAKIYWSIRHIIDPANLTQKAVKTSGRSTAKLFIPGRSRNASDRKSEKNAIYWDFDKEQKGQE